MPAKTKAAMTNARNRVLLAKDVIAQLRAGKLEAKQGFYVRLHENRSGASIFKPSDVGKKDVRDTLKTRVKSCEVCAIGAIFIAQTMRYGDILVTSDMVQDFPHRNALNYMACKMKYECHHFTKRQLRGIEYAFERSFIYREAFPEPRDRLIAIMENVIRNKGDFVL